MAGVFPGVFPGVLGRVWGRVWVFLLLATTLAACSARIPENTQTRILLLGDSMMAANRDENAGVAAALQQHLGEPVLDRSVSGARYLGLAKLSGIGLYLPNQYRSGKWQWVVVNGGGNDLLLSCACRWCAGTLERLISPDGSRGAVPDFVAQLRSTGAQVLYTGYLRTPGVTSPIEGCTQIGTEFETRLARMAARDEGVRFVGLTDLVPMGARSYHNIDLIHPSAKGSNAIAGRLAQVMAAR